MNIGNYLRNSILNETIAGTGFVPADTLEIRLFSTTLTAAGVGTEITNAGYARKTISNDTTNFPTSTSGTKTNALRIDIDAATEDWDDVLAVGLFDEDDNLYFYENFPSAISILNGQNLFFDAGDISISLS